MIRSKLKIITIVTAAIAAGYLGISTAVSDLSEITSSKEKSANTSETLHSNYGSKNPFPAIKSPEYTINTSTTMANATTDLKIDRKSSKLIQPSLLNLDNFIIATAGMRPAEIITSLEEIDPQSDCISQESLAQSCIYWRFGLSYLKYTIEGSGQFEFISCRNNGQRCYKTTYTLDESWIIVNQTLDEVEKCGKNGVRRASAPQKLLKTEPYHP